MPRVSNMPRISQTAIFVHRIIEIYYMYVHFIVCALTYSTTSSRAVWRS